MDEMESTSGGIWQVLVAIYVGFQMADEVYKAGKSFSQAYEENRDYDDKTGQL